jgi:HTH-type transcriptional regulator/antitoxin HigA
MEIKPIRTDAEHEAALREIERLWGAPEQTPDGDRLEVLLALVEAYEHARHPIDWPSPIDAIRFRLDQLGLDRRALIGVIGTRSRVHEVLNGVRALSLAMIRRLHERFDIPAEVLIRPTKRRKPRGRRVA